MLRKSKILLAGIVLAPLYAALPQSSGIRFDGIGTVRIGMSLPDLNRVLHTSYLKPSDPDERSCFYVDMPGQPGVTLMILNSRVGRVDIDNAVTATAEGIHNGDS
jgi:hypothetical protein